MLTNVLSALLVLVSSFSTPEVQDAPWPPKLSSSERQNAKSVVRRFALAKDDEAKEAAAREFVSFGHSGLEIFDEARRDKTLAPSLPELEERARHWLGLELIEKTKDSKAPVWSPSYFAADEIVLLRREELKLAFAISEPSRSPTAGVFEVRWWSPNSSSAMLPDAGSKLGTVSVQGREVTAFRPNAAFKDYEFEVEVEGVKLEFHFVGPSDFTYRYADGNGLAYTGMTNPQKCNFSIKGLRFLSKPAGGLTRLPLALADYLYLVVPGCERLPLEGAEREAFAQYEQVQIQWRCLRVTGSLLVLVSILEPDRVGLERHHEIWITNFVRECIRSNDITVLIMGGNSPGLEANRFYMGGEWKAPDDKMKKLLRANFPEAY